MAPADKDVTEPARENRLRNRQDMAPHNSLRGSAPLPADAAHLAEQNLLWQRVSHRLKAELGEAKWRA